MYRLTQDKAMLTGEQLGAAIRVAIEKKGVSQVAVAAHFGVKPPSVQDWINRGTIGKEKLPKLWDYFADVAGPEHWGLSAANAPYQSDGGVQSEISIDGANVIPSAHSLQQETSDVVIRQFQTGGSMGKGIVLAEQPGVIKEWRVSERWAQENVHRITSVKNLAIVTGFGPSMQPLFNPGDPLLVDRGINRADVDGIYFFRVGEEGFVKQLQRIPTAQGLILRAKSYNTLYDPFDITHGMDFEVFARVVKVWKGEEF